MVNNRISLNLTTLKGPHTPKGLVGKIAAAAKAGFHAVGLDMQDIERWLSSGRKLHDLDKIITDAGLKVSDLCGVTVCDEHGMSADRTKEFATACALGAPCVVVFYDYPKDSKARVAEHWAAFLDVVSDIETVKAGLHFQSDRGSVCDLETACDIVAEGPTNGALVLDVFEFWHGSGAAASLNASPIESTILVQLSDTMNPIREEARNEDRTFPGEGVMPLTHMVSTLLRRGCEAPFSVEMPNGCGKLSARKAAERAYQHARRLLGSSGPSHRKH